MHRRDYPATSFGYVDGDIRLLLHHDPAKVKDGKEHDTVDPLLLMLSMELVDVVPLAEEVREDVRRHLQMHANVILYTDPDSAGLPIALHDKLRDFAFFKASLSGTSEVPPVTTNARGVLYLSYDKRTRELSWFGYHADLSGPETAAHFHIGKGGKVGDVVIPVSLGNPKDGSIILDEGQVKALFEGNMYFNVHSSAFPVGEIRGQVIPAATSRSNNEQVVPPGTPLVDANPGPGTVIRPSKETKPKAQTYEPTQKEPGSAGGTNGGPDVAKPPSEGKPKAEVRQTTPGDSGAVYGQETLPGGTDVRPGIKQAAGVPGEDMHDDGEMHPPKEGNPSADVRQIEKVGDGAAYSATHMPGMPRMDEEHPDGKKKKKKNNGEMRQQHGPTYSGRVDYARPLINIIVDPERQPASDETVRNIMESGTPTGVDGPPKVSVSNLSDPKNAALKEAVEASRKTSIDERPGPGSITLRDRVISLLTDEGFRGRLVIFPVTGSEDARVMRIEAAKWTTAFINNLPDSSFAVIERGGKKEDGKTVPRGYRHLPYKDASGKVDLPHLRNALARMNQLKAVSPKDSTERIRRVARSVLVRVAREHLPGTKFAKSSQFSFREMLAEIDAELCRLVAAGDLSATAQLMEVKEENSVKLFSLKMGSKEDPVHFFVRVTYDGDGNAKWVQFDFDTLLPARVAEDFAKFLKSLPVKKED